MSNLNIFMKNNKGYYHWIHSLKSAAIDSFSKGQEMLQEQKKKIEESKERSGYIPSALQHVEKGFRKEGIPAEPHREDMPSETAHQIQAKILAKKMAVGNERQFTTPRDAKSVVADAQDGVMGDEMEDEGDEGEPIKMSQVKPAIKPGKTSPIAARARVEAGFPLPGDQEIVDDEDKNEQEPPERTTEVSDEYGNLIAMPMESLNYKINKFLHG
jgi:hypothetical protein